MSDAVTIVGIVASPSEGGRTTTAVAGILAGAAKAGAHTRLIELASTERDAAIAALDAADGVVFGSPVYRATHSAQLKDLLENTQRGLHGETTAPLRGKAAAIALTGASAHHFLSPDGVRNILASFFATQVLSPALYLEHKDFADRETLGDEASGWADQHGAALAELTRAVRGSKALSSLNPLV